ncbi:hypothetical protein [Paenibacillus cremeus]|uniref:hypothetical protein n=1 Tax=Paenibacillus cremeus TaxID=2163881 RepID=UPI001645783D|nr:hypothetical protein [Paenibacillus cremeus]
MKTTTRNYEPSFKGLGLIVILFCAATASPLLYFLINLMLGNEHLFNGIIMN